MLLTRFLIVLKYLFVNLVDPLHNVLDFGQGSILIVVDRDSILHPGQELECSSVCSIS